MKLSRSLILMLMLLGLAALACNFVTGDDGNIEEEATVVVGESAQPSVTPVPPEPTETPSEPTPAVEVLPTAPPATDTPTPVEPEEPEGLILADTPYVDTDGHFTLVPPSDWIQQELFGGATFSAPDDSGFIDVELTNTGIVLGGADFERFVDAREANYFGTFLEYEQLNRQIDGVGGAATVTKRVSFDGIPQLIFSNYIQQDAIVLVVDFWADLNLAPVYRDAYEQVFDTVTFDSVAAAADLELYAWIFTFYGPNDLFSIEVPMPWNYDLAEGDAAIVETFYSPDEHGIIQNIAYDDGTEISRSEAGAFALDLLRTYYAEDIRITDDQVQPDGSERLTWNSPGGDYGGISFLETRGTTFLLFSVLWDNPFEDVYYDVLNYTISTYDVPESE